MKTMNTYFKKHCWEKEKQSGITNISGISQVYGSFRTVKACNIVDG